MVSRYSVIQYVPDPIANERINIGVVAFDNNTVLTKFVKKWERVRNFGGEEISFLKDFAHRMENGAKDGLLFPGDEPNGVPNQERLLKIAQGWMNSIQFTEPRGSLNTVNDLLEDIASTYLHENKSALNIIL